MLPGALEHDAKHCNNTLV